MITFREVMNLDDGDTKMTRYLYHQKHEIVCPDGHTFKDAASAAQYLSRHWRSAGYVSDWIQGIPNWDPEELVTCETLLWDPRERAVLWDSKEYDNPDYGWAIWPCSGGCISFQDGRLIATSDKRQSLIEENIRAEIADDFYTNEHDYDLVRKLRLESGLVYSPNGEVGTVPIPDDPAEGTALEAEIYISFCWEKFHKRIPANYELVDGYASVPEMARIGIAIKNLEVKTWLKYVKNLPNNATHHDRVALLLASSWFSAKSLDQLVKYDANWNSLWSTYEGIPDERVPLLKKSRTNEFIRALRRIPKDISLTDKMSVKEMISMSEKYIYDNVQNQEVAHAAFSAGLSQYEFDEYQRYWSNINDKTHETIPSVGIVQKDGYIMYRLEVSDPRGPILGIFTNCCQHPGGAGASCAIHGQESPDGAFFVVERRGKIVAQSWAWRRGKTLCFDSIEVLNKNYMPVVEALYQETANRILGKLGITACNVGGGYNNVGVSSDWQEVVPVLPPEGVYTDAKTQFVICSDDTWDYFSWRCENK